MVAVASGGREASPVSPAAPALPRAISVRSAAREWFDDPMRLPLDVIPEVIGQLEQLKAVLWARLNAPAFVEPESAPDASRDDDLMSVDQTARMLGVSVRWVYRHYKDLPFARRLSRKTLRFSAAGLRHWLAYRDAKGRS